MKCKKDSCECEIPDDVIWAFCPRCGFDQSKDPDKEPFCVISVPNAETAAYLRGLLRATVTGDGECREACLEDCFPGGLSAIHDVSGKIKDTNLYSLLVRALNAAGIDKDHAPWLTPKAPTEVGCRTAEYNELGVKFVNDTGQFYHFSAEEVHAMDEKIQGLIKKAKGE